MPKLPVSIHPAADLFRLMSEEEFAGLKADIAEHGVREPMVMWKDQLLDGRNRLAACVELGIDYEGHLAELDDDIDPIAYVISHNLHRRHLTPSQKAMVAFKLKELLEPEAKERQKATRIKDGKPVREILPAPAANGRARDKAAAAVGISGKLVDAAEKVTKKGTPELQAAVVKGDVSVSRAAKIADAPKDQQASLIDAPRQQSDEPPPLKRLIEREANKLTIARWLFDSCSEAQRAQVSVAWSDWWKDVA